MKTTDDGKRVLTKEDKKMLGSVRWYCEETLNVNCDECVFRDFIGCPKDAADVLAPKKTERRKAK